MKKHLLYVCALLLITACSKQAEEDEDASSDDGGGSGVTLGPRYKTGCDSLGGTVYGASYKVVYFIISGSSYSWITDYHSNASCSSKVNTIATGGTVTVGSATTTPAGAYDITFSHSSITVQSSGGSAAAFDAGCGTNTAAAAGASYAVNVSGTGANCGDSNYDVEPAGALYNVFTLSGGTLTLGLVGGANPGSFTAPTTVSVVLTAY